MLPIPVEIKDKLLKALDDNNDVDEATVVEMLSVLEKYPITRATLEETKIGKMVNDLRRKIKNEKLAKRVKQLVRNWKKILDETPPVNGGIPGPTHPAITQLRSSPAGSPALSRVPSTGRLVSPAQGKVSPAQGKVTTPKTVGQKSASPATAGYRPGTAGGRKGLSPATGANGLATPSAAVQKVASPALSGSHPKVASPALAARSASPTVSGWARSPAISSRVDSQPMSGRVVSPAVSGHVTSPAAFAGVGRGKGKLSPLVGQSPVQSPGLQAAASTATMTNRRKNAVAMQRLKKVASASEMSGLGDKAASSASLSEHSVDRLDGEMRRGGLDSDDESSCSSSKAGHSDNALPRNHSVKMTLMISNSNNKNCKDQRELSKTNMANRKRAREKSGSPEESSKQGRLESFSLSANSHRHDKVINGYTSKSSKKNAGLEASRVHSVSSMPSVHKQVSSPHMSRTVNEESASLPHSHSDSFLMRQESTDSHQSAQSFERPSRDRHKVKTTEQLIEDLQKNGSQIGHSIMTKLRTNQIEQEQDVPGSVLPAGMKPRGKRGRPRKSDIVSVPPSNVKLSQVKSELVERFLKTSDPSSPVEEFSPFKDDLLPDPAQSTLKPSLDLGACTSPYSTDNLDSISASRQDLSELAPKDENSRDAMSPPVPSTSQTGRTGSAQTLEDIYAQLPPIDDDIDWDAVDFFELPKQTPVTVEAVDRLHNERLSGINGLYDTNGDWTRWNEMVTLPSYENNPLHVLPYVDLDN